MDWITLMDGDDLLKARKIGDTGYWWVLQSTYLPDCVGEEEAAEMSGTKRMLTLGELSLVPGREKVSEEIVRKVEEGNDWGELSDAEEAWVEMAHTYGLKVLVNSAYGATNESAVKKALKEACVDLDGNVDHHLDRPVNLIGQTGHEHLAQDMDSCLKRAACHEGASDEQRLMAKISGPKMRQVRQKNLSSECMMVQVWGLDHCNTCEYKGSAQCGGQNIRKTGHNENGLKVPVS